VKKNQRLFSIDPAPYQAAYDQAAAQLKQAQANLFSADTLAKRYAPLVKANAVSKQEYDNAMANYHQATAAVVAAKANLRTAKINLDYTQVVSPVAGRIGAPLVTEGALVDAASATYMALVQQLDPVYVDFTQSTSELAVLRQAFAQGKLQKVGEQAAGATLVLEDGTNYAQPGKLLFTGITVDPTTGQVALRAQFPNPDHILLPGMYVHVRLTQGVDEKGLLVPQQALQRTPDGLQSVMRVKNGKVEQVSVATGRTMNGNVLINRGLQAGDVVVVEGFQKVRPGAPVKVTPWAPPGSPAASRPPAKPGDAKSPAVPTPPAAPAPAASEKKS
jgi:membrane fusion protein (multidrug efflux system)